MNSVVMDSIRRGLHATCIWGLPLLTSALVFSLACPPEATADTAKELNKAYEEALTPGALAKCEARLKQLKAGQAMTAEAFGFEFFSVSGGEKGEFIAVADGWIPSLSGRLYGAMHMIGRLCARDSANVWGEHLFGYISGGVTLHPKYRVLTRATVISEADYAGRKKDASVGALILSGLAQQLYFADPVFMEIQDIPVPDVGETSKTKEIKDLIKYSKELRSEDNYQEAQRLLDELPVGTRLTELWTKLHAVLITFDQGQDFAILMKGYLNEDPLSPWTIATSEAYYDVWTFGTLIKGKPNPRRSVVFRNAALARVQPYVPREELTKTLPK